MQIVVVLPVLEVKNEGALFDSKLCLSNVKHSFKGRKYGDCSHERVLRWLKSLIFINVSPSCSFSHLHAYALT